MSGSPERWCKKCKNLNYTEDIDNYIVDINTKAWGEKENI